MGKEMAKKTSRKEVRKIIFKKLTGALSDHKLNLKKNGIENDLKRISKILAADIVKAARRRDRKAKKANKKNKKDKAELLMN